MTIRPENYVDVLFLAALEEELFVLRDLFSRPHNNGFWGMSVASNHDDSADVRLGEKHIRLGWRDLGGMGNVGAYHKAQEWIGRLCPRAVVLIGVAGAPQGGVLARGDVAYASQIGYGAFGKIEDVPIFTWLQSRIGVTGRLDPEVKQYVAALEGRLGGIKLPEFRLRDCTPINVGRRFQDFAKTTRQQCPINWRQHAVDWCKAGVDSYLLQHADQEVGIDEVTCQVATDSELKALRGYVPSGSADALTELSKAAVDARTIATVLTKLVSGPIFSLDISKDSRLQYVESQREKVRAEVYTARFNRLALEHLLPLTLRPKYANLFEHQPPKASDAVFASGEAIIASRNHQGLLVNGIRHVDKQKKLHQNAGVFEMESYGVALCCSERQIPFSVVKGISDLADDTKTDSYRLAALSGATSFSLAMVLSKPHLYEILTWDRHGWSESACVWPTEGGRRACAYSCRTGEGARFSRWRNCTHGLFTSGRELDAVRVLESVESTEYSRYIERVLEENSAVVRLVFPYDVKELLAFLRSTTLRDGAERLEKLLRRMGGVRTSARKGGKKGEAWKALKKQVIDIGFESYQQHSHFRVSNELCASKIGKTDGLQLHELAKQVCRVVSVPYENVHSIIDDPAFLLHIRMCGVCVPTILAKRDRDAGYDEATFVVRESAAELRDSQEQTSACMKYLQESGLLMVFGTCSSQPQATGKHKLFKALNDVEKWLNVVAKKPKEICKDNGLAPFPVALLLERHEIDPLTLLPDTELRSKNVEGYFQRLKEVEQLYWGS